MSFRVFDPSPELPQELLGRPFFETPLAFFQEQIGVVLQDSVLFPETPLRPVPGVLDAFGVVVATNETFLVIDRKVMKGSHCSQSSSPFRQYYADQRMT